MEKFPRVANWSDVGFYAQIQLVLNGASTALVEWTAKDFRKLRILGHLLRWGAGVRLGTIGGRSFPTKTVRGPRSETPAWEPTPPYLWPRARWLSTR